MSRPLQPAWILALATLALVAACAPVARDACTNDDDCPPGDRCDINEGTCLDAITDAGHVDAGNVDAGNVDAGVADAGHGLVVHPAAVTFGPVNVNTVSEERVEVSNTGPDPIELKTLTITSGATEIAIAREWLTDCQGAPRGEPLTVLEVGQCTRFAVRLLPLEAHEVVGNIRLETDDLLRPIIDIPVTAIAASPALKVCVVNPDNTLNEALCTSFNTEPNSIPTLDFGPVVLNDELSRLLRVFNEGDGSLLFTKTSIEVGPEMIIGDFTMTNGSDTGTVAAHSSRDLSVTFRPDADGEALALAVLETNDPAHPIVKIPLRGDAKGPKFCVLPETGLDFLSVVVGQTRTLPIEFENCGYVPYNITNFDFVEELRESVEFTITGMPPPMPMAFAPGDKITVQVTYKPSRVHPASDVTGDRAFFTIHTNYPINNIPVVGRGASPGCATGVAPVANIRIFKNGTSTLAPTNAAGDPTGEPLDLMQLDGGNSTVRAGGTPTYVWRLASRPANSSVNISGTGVRPRLFLELAGDYVVELIVKDQYGCESAPKTVTIRSVPKGKIHLQLTWLQSFGDVDLHYLGPGGAFFAAGDTHWLNKTPDWGQNNTVAPDSNRTNDPTLDLDDMWGNGPENASHNLPFDGVYKVLVHYFCSRQGVSGLSLGASTPTLKIYVDGVLQLDASKSLTQRDIWEVATITVSGGGASIVAAASTTAVTKSSASVTRQSCTPDGD